MRLLFIFTFVLMALGLSAQPKQNSPYSRFGLGDPLPQYFANQAAMGGMTVAFHDPYHLNIENPASFAFLRATAFEAGLNAKRSNYTSGDATSQVWSGNLAYMALGFTLRSPINEVLDRKQSPWQWGMGVALTPSYLVGYNVETVSTQPDLGEVTSAFQGNGGAYRLLWNNAVKYKHTALGLNLGWVFGENTYENTTSFTSDSFPTFSDNFRDEHSLNGFVWKVGLQHDWVLKYDDKEKESPRRWITFGLSGESSHSLNTSNDQLIVRSRGKTDLGQYRTPDTLLYTTGVAGSVSLPAGFRGGLQYVDGTRLKLGVEYAYENASTLGDDFPGQEFRNTHTFRTGVEYTPDYGSYNNYSKRMRYRAGAYYRQDPRVVNGEGVDDLGLSVGIGFPIVLPRQQTSFVNTALEIGQIGSGTAIEETYFKLTLGFTLNDNSWFYKRRFE